MNNQDYIKKLLPEIEDWQREIIAGLLDERDEAIRVLRVLKGDIDHLGHWIPDPCRAMVDSFLLKNAKLMDADQLPPELDKDAPRRSMERLVRLRWAWRLLSNNAPIDDAILLEADKAEDFTALQDAFGEFDPAGAPEPIQPLMLVDAWCSLTLPYEL